MFTGSINCLREFLLFRLYQVIFSLFLRRRSCKALITSISMSVCDRLIDIEEEPFRTHFYSRIHNSTPNINPHPTLNSYLNTIQKTKLIFDLFKRHRFLALLTKDFGVRDLWLFFSRFCYRCLLAIISEPSTSYNELLQRFKFVNPWNTCIEYIFVLFSRKKIAFAFILRSILG